MVITEPMEILFNEVPAGYPLPLAEVCAVRTVFSFSFTNVTGFLFSRVMAPDVAASQQPVFRIPADIPTSGDAALDRIIFEAGEKQGIDPRFLHAVIWQDQSINCAHVRMQALRG